MREFRRERLTEILRWIEQADDVRFRVLDPDLGRGRYAGELVEIDGEPWVHRPLRVWVDLAERLGMRLCTPRPAAPPAIELRMERLGTRYAPRGDAPERYGAGTEFQRISKLEDPWFLLDLEEALARVGLAPGARVLELGCNTGDLFALLPRDARVVGVDHSASALDVARLHHPAAELVLADVAHLPPLGRFGLVIAIGLVQSGALDDRALLRYVVQELLAPDGAVIVGWPNCRYVDGEIAYGARIRNLSEPELGLVVKDIAFYRKYLQQHRRRVFVTGRYELLVTAVAEPSGA